VASCLAQRLPVPAGCRVRAQHHGHGGFPGQWGTRTIFCSAMNVTPPRSHLAAMIGVDR
jgi:hypothetical protein